MRGKHGPSPTCSFGYIKTLSLVIDWKMFLVELEIETADVIDEMSIS
jgi:hypothetical protein